MLGIIILNYNNDTDILRCINSLVQHTDMSQVKLLIVDNGSKEVISKKIECFLLSNFSECRCFNHNDRPQALSSVNYIRLQSNIGYARGNNVGLKMLFEDADVNDVLIVNSDILFEEDVVTPLVSKLYEVPNVGSISPMLYNLNGEIDYCCARKNYDHLDLTLTFSYLFSKKYRQRISERYILKQYPELITKELVEIELPSGSCMLFKKDVLRDIGGFDENTFLYYEESILFKRLCKQGKKNYLMPSVNCIHLGGATTTTTKTPYFLKRCNYESMIYYCKTYEHLNKFQLFYIMLTGNLVMFRLWLGYLYHKLF